MFQLCKFLNSAQPAVKCTLVSLWLPVYLFVAWASPALAIDRPSDYTLPLPIDFLRAPKVSSYADLSKSAIDLAVSLGIDDELRRLEALSQEPAASRDRLEMLVLKQALSEQIMSQGFEVRSVISKIDTEIADSDDLQALLEERRDRAVRLNSIANFVSGGVTGILGSSFNLGGIDKRVDDSIDLSDGVVQSGLALLALKQQRGEKRIASGLPNMLSRVLGSKPAVEYPETVWNFLNAVPNAGSETRTRRQIMMEHWRRLGLIDRNRRDKTAEDERLKTIVGTKPQSKVSIDLLDARSAMLHDLRAMVSEMDNYLLELTLFLKTIKI